MNATAQELQHDQFAKQLEGASWQIPPLTHLFPTRVEGRQSRPLGVSPNKSRRALRERYRVYLSQDLVGQTVRRELRGWYHQNRRLSLRR